MFYVYVLKSEKDKLGYIGCTKDLRKRIKEHNLGKVKSTAPRIPFKLVYYEAYADQNDAFNRESRLKLKSKAYAQLQKRIQESFKT